MGPGRWPVAGVGEEGGQNGMVFGPGVGAQDEERWVSSIGRAQSSGSESCWRRRRRWRS